MKEIKSINFSMSEIGHETQLILADNTTKYIFISSSMILVSNWPYVQLAQLIDTDVVEPVTDFEAYDTVDGQPYYTNSEYSEYINCALLDITHRTL